MKALCLVASKKKIFFYVFPIVSLWDLILNDPRGGPRGMVGRICKEDHYTLLHTNMKALGLVVSETISFLCFSNDAPGVGPIWTPGARLAGFIKRTTIHCYTQNMKVLCFVDSEKKIFFVFPIVSLWDLMTPKAGPFLTPGAW